MSHLTITHTILPAGLKEFVFKHTKDFAYLAMIDIKYLVLNMSNSSVAGKLQEGS